MKSSADPLKSRHSLVQASAGSGKTFALTNRYLRLIAAGVSGDSILATTFTRKAAGEILDRIMQRLTAAASDPAACRRLAGELGIEWNVLQVRQALRHLCENLHRLQISTLDSFFGRLARVFSFELGLPPEWQVVEGGRIEVLSELAVRSLLNDRNTRSFLHLVTRKDAERKIAEMMLQQVAGYFELYRDSTPEAWQHESPRCRNFSPRLQQLCTETEVAPLKTASLNQVWEKDRQLLSTGNYEKVLECNLFSHILDGKRKYRNSELPSDLWEFFQQVIELARAQAATAFAERTASAWRLVHHFAQELWPLQMAAAQLRFSDVTHVLKRLVTGHTQAEWEYRLDQPVQHLLLDEFQDTAPGQWQILEPLAQRIIRGTTNGTFFCVGDKKQAIYGWRGGVSEIFDVVEQQFQRDLGPSEPLQKSYRSSPVVIAAVNRVFQNLANTGIEREPDRQTLTEWQKAFPEHTTARTDYPGWVHVERVTGKSTPESTGESGGGKDRLFARTVAQIEELHRRAPHLSVGVLVGSHADIAKILFQLNQLGIPASEEGGNTLEDSAAVNLVLSALKLADHPQDSLSRFHLSHSPLGKRWGLEPETLENQSVNAQRAERAAADLRRRLGRWGYGAVIEDLGQDLDAACTPRERRRLDQLIELAYDYREPWTLRTIHFLQTVAKTKVLEPSAAKVRVMTIHAAKGLEFDAVVAPFFGQPGRWKSSTPNVVYSRSNPSQPIDLVHLYASEIERKLLPPKIQTVFEDYRRQEIRERLSVLYVLLTRAIHALYVFLPNHTREGQTSLASLVLGTLRDDSQDPAGDVIYQQGQADWMDQVVPAAPEPVTHEIPVFFQAGRRTHSASSENVNPMRREDATESESEKVKPGRRRAQVQPTVDPTETVVADQAQILPSVAPERPSPVVGTESVSLPGDAALPTSQRAASARRRGTSSRRSRAESIPTDPQQWLQKYQAQEFGTALHLCLEQVDWWENRPTAGRLKNLLRSAGLNPASVTRGLEAWEQLALLPNFQRLLREPLYRDELRQIHGLPAHPLFEPLRLEVKRELTFDQLLAGNSSSGRVDRLVLGYEGSQVVWADIIEFKTDHVTDGNWAGKLDEYRPQLESYRRTVIDALRLPPERVIARWYFLANDRVHVLAPRR